MESQRVGRTRHSGLAEHLSNWEMDIGRMPVSRSQPFFAVDRLRRTHPAGASGDLRKQAEYVRKGRNCQPDNDPATAAAERIFRKCMKAATCAKD
jgi:hypothetical protein